MSKIFAVQRFSVGLLSLVLLCGGMLRAEMPIIIAHRGASYDAPENTLAAFRLAWEQGADGIEADFYLSKDGKIVCFHDKTAKKNGGVDRPVAEMTFAEIRKLDVGSWKSPKYAGERVPTLDEVLAVVPEGKLIYVEIKCGPEIVPHLPAAFKASGLKNEQIRIICFQEDVIAACKEQLPEIKAFWLTSYKQNKETKKWTPTPAKVRQTLQETKANGLGTKAEPNVVDEAFVEALREGGWEFHTWTINEIPLAQHFQELGVDSITTDRPAYIRKGLKKATVSRER